MLILTIGDDGIKKESKTILIILLIGIILSLFSGYLFYNYLYRKYWDADVTQETLLFGFSAMIFYNVVLWLYMILEEKNKKIGVLLKSILIVYLFILIIDLINFYACIGLAPFSYPMYEKAYLAIHQIGFLSLVVFLIWFCLKRKYKKE